MSETSTRTASPTMAAGEPKKEGGSPALIALLLLGLLAVGIVVAVMLSSGGGPDLDGINDALVAELTDTTGVEDISQPQPGVIRFTYNGKPAQIVKERASYDGTNGNAIYTINTGSSEFRGNLMANANGDGTWTIQTNSDGTSFDRLWSGKVEADTPGSGGSAPYFIKEETTTKILPNVNPQVMLRTDKGDILIELWEDRFPNSVAHFIDLIERDYYNGTRFHRVMDNFMIQGGDDLSKDLNQRNRWGTGGNNYRIDASGEAPDGLLHDRAGLISWAHSGSNTNIGTQFFITNHATGAISLNQRPVTSRHPIFGAVLDGMETVMKITEAPKVDDQTPRTPVVLTNAWVVQKQDHQYVPRRK